MLEKHQYPQATLTTRFDLFFKYKTVLAKFYFKYFLDYQCVFDFLDVFVNILQRKIQN